MTGSFSSDGWLAPACYARGPRAVPKTRPRNIKLQKCGTQKWDQFWTEISRANSFVYGLGSLFRAAGIGTIFGPIFGSQIEQNLNLFCVFLVELGCVGRGKSGCDAILLHSDMLSVSSLSFGPKNGLRFLQNRFRGTKHMVPRQRKTIFFYLET